MFIYNSVGRILIIISILNWCTTSIKGLLLMAYRWLTGVIGLLFLMFYLWCTWLLPILKHILLLLWIYNILSKLQWYSLYTSFFKNNRLCMCIKMKEYWNWYRYIRFICVFLFAFIYFLISAYRKNKQLSLSSYKGYNTCKVEWFYIVFSSVIYSYIWFVC